MGDLALNVIRGVRPTKPGNASAIGFSDSLWGFVRRCWDKDAKLRPKVGKVVNQLGRAAADWDGVMPPFVETKNIVSVSEEAMSGSMEHCEFEILILP